MAVVAGLVVKRFWPMRHSRLAVNARVISGHAPAEVAQWREMARMRPRTLGVFEFNCPYRGSEAAVGDETIIMIRLSGIGLS